MRSARCKPIVLACMLSVLFGALVMYGLHYSQSAYALDTPAAKADRAAAIDMQNAFTSVADELKPSVVFIKAYTTDKGGDMPDIGDLFPGFPFGGPGTPRSGQPRQSVAAGSGVIVRADGYILTNDHVVSGADRVTVKLSDGKEFTGKVFRDPKTDLALVKIDAKGLTAAKLGDSDKVKVGQWSIAIGAPFGLTNTVTVGVISALSREAAVPDPSVPTGGRGYFGLIQTDASINPGNSGGPLVNIYGEVIGINSIIESPSGANSGVGFSIPIDTAKFVMEQLIATGKVVRGYLGLIPKDITPAAARTLGTDKGALVDSVDDDTPASKAGIKPMDVIVEINGKKIDDSLALRTVVSQIKPGQKIPIAILRDGKRQNIDVTITEAPDIYAAVAPAAKSKLGMSVQEITPTIAEQLGIKTGVVVKSVDSDGAASRANPPITAGDVIGSINQQPVATVAEFNKVVSGLKSGDTALVLLKRKGTDDGKIRTTISELTLD